MDDRKELYDDVNGNPTPGTDCESVGEARGLYLERLKNWFESQYSDWNGKKNAYEEAKNNHESLTCSDKESEYTTKKSACDATLKSIEDNACSAAQEAHIRCDGYDSCYDEKVADYENAEKITQEQVEGYKVQWRAITRLRCIVQELTRGPSDATGLSDLDYCTGTCLHRGGDSLQFQVVT